jgi:predicted CoA-binding protein
MEEANTNALTLVIGASPDASRYAYLACGRLEQYGHHWLPMGIKTGEVFGKTVLDMRSRPAIENVDTLTLYIGTRNQEQWEDYWLSLKPRRIIFNPGTENPQLVSKAREQGIEIVHGCTLVMISTGQY